MQVQDDSDEFYIGPDVSDYDTDDSNGNSPFFHLAFLFPVKSECLCIYYIVFLKSLMMSAENNPRNDYPDEESDSDDEEHESDDEGPDYDDEEEEENESEEEASEDYYHWRRREKTKERFF